MGSSLAYAAIFNHTDVEDLLDRGFACSTGTQGNAIDLVEAHKWFNLAVLGGSEQAQYCRSDIADQMSRAQIAEAQRSARTWLATHAAN